VEKVLGYGREELIGRDVFELIHPDDREAARTVLKRIIRDPGHDESIELRIRHQRGSWRHMEAIGKSIIDSANTVRVIVNSRDVTDRKKLEESILNAQKLESLGTLAGGIAHDFNNLTTGIMANIGLAKLKVDRGDELYAILEKVDEASVRARDLASQFLTFSLGGDPVKRTVVPGDMVKDAARFALRGSKSGCSFSIAGDLRTVEADEGQMRQVVSNVVQNAEQAMPEGGMVTIACDNVTVGENELPPLKPGEFVRITVHDDGIGIPREHLARVFDPYFTTKKRGSGLGLATSYSIIRKHGGAITVESEAGAGTTFMIYLPATPKKTAGSPQTSEALIPGQGKILIMDDEAIVRDSAGMILRAAGYEVALASDGNEAIELYRKAYEAGSPFAVVILDLTVPGGTGGKDALKKLFEIDPGVKAIVSSGYSHDPIMANYRDYGFAGVIAKPYKIGEISGAVRKVITQSG
jgi:PAS domain S-box-containing protein